MGEHQAARHSESSPNGHRNAARDKLDVHDEGMQDRSNGHHVFRVGDRVSTAQGDGTVKQAFVDRVTVLIDGAERVAFFMPHELKAPF